MMRSARGTTANLSGAMAEDAVLREYRGQGAELLARRWRGRSGEIDLILQADAALIFVEVKSAATHDAAAERIHPAQARRIMGAAEEYLAATGRPLATEMRFDAALVDATGRVAILPDAFAGF